MKKTGILFLKNDNFKLGISLGLIFPMLIFFAIYYFRFSYYSFDAFLDVLRQENRLITFFGTWCMVGNIALFTVYINTGRYNTAKGIFTVTLIYGIMVLLLKVLN